MDIFELDRSLTERYAHFARSFAEIRAPETWAKCVSEDERLNIYNGLLLSSLWDAAFDTGLLTFADDGEPVLSRQASEGAKRALMSSPASSLPLHSQHRERLAWHRANIFQE